MKSQQLQALPKRKRGRPLKEEAAEWQDMLNATQTEIITIGQHSSSSSSSSSSLSASSPSGSSSSTPTTSTSGGSRAQSRDSPLSIQSGQLNGPSSSTPKVESRKAYRLAFKIAALRHAEKNDISKAARKYKVDRKTIRTWLRSKPELIEKAKKRNKFRIGKGDTVQYSELEAELYEWILTKRLTLEAPKFLTTRSTKTSQNDSF